MDYIKFTKTHLWNAAFVDDDTSLFKEERDILKREYLDFREKVKNLVGRISYVLPGLTVHDISHRGINKSGVWGDLNRGGDLC